MTPPSGLAARWIGWIGAHPRAWLTGWALIAIGLGAGAGLLKERLKVGGFSIPGTQFFEASRILTRDFGMASEKLVVAAIRSDLLRVNDPAFRDAAESAFDRLRTHPKVDRIESFYTTGIPDLVSFDNRVTFAFVHLRGTEEELERATPEFRKLALTPEGSGVEVILTGQPIANFDIEVLSSSDVAKVDLITFPLILVLLILFLKNWRAGLVPLGTGILSVVLGLGGVFLLTLFMPVSVFAMNIATMIGLGLSIDFSLILLFRFQEELATVSSAREAVVRALARSGRSVFFSGFTLFTTVSILTLFPIMIIRSIAQAILVSTIAALLVFYGLLPGILLRWGDRFRPRTVDLRGRESLLMRLARWSIDRPALAASVTLVLLLAAAAPTLGMRKIGTTLEGVPESVGSRRAVDAIQGAFGRGAVAPLLIVMDTDRPDGIWDRQALRLVHSIHATLTRDPRIDKVQSLMSLIPNPSETWAMTLSKEGIRSNGDLKRVASRFVQLDQPTQSTFFLVYSKQAETHPDTIALLESVRSNLPGWTRDAPHLRLVVGGTPAQHYDFDKAVFAEAPPLVVISLLVTFFVLMVFFRSILLPVKAVAMNLLSLVASFGLMVLVFQRGHGDWLLGFRSLGGVQIYTPVLLFSILFGLSTDYEVFVLSRIKEFLNTGLPTREAALLGIEKSSRVIGAAAAVMVLVFFSFAFSSVVAVKEIGFSLAVAVFLDATIVRMALVPASLVLMERLNWWFPRPIARFLPEVED